MVLSGVLYFVITIGVAEVRRAGREHLPLLVRGPLVPEAKTFSAFTRSMKVADLPIFLKFGNAENQRYGICVAITTPLHRSSSSVQKRSPGGV